MAHTVVEKSMNISCVDYNLATGTWTLTDTSNIFTQVKTTADDTSIIRIPVNIERIETGSGVKITKFETLYKVGTVDLDAAPSVKLLRIGTEAGPTALDITLTATTAMAVTATAGLVKCVYTVTYPAFDRIEANNSTDNKTTVPVGYVIEYTVATDADNSFEIGDTAVYYQIEE